MAGKEGCPCIDTTSALSSLTEQYCTLSDGSSIGVQLTVGGSCVPFTYGASSCLQHDLINDPKCTLDQLLSVSNGVNNATNSSSNNIIIVPPYCFRSFCYVDPNTCKKQSDERVYRSGYFGYDTGVELFYSYSTCNSTADDWLEVEDDIVGHSALGGIGIDAAVPAYVLPMMYKRDSSGEIIPPEETGDEYFDDSIPYEGLYINYAKSIMEISNGDIRSMNFTHRSRVSSILHPTSKFTAAVQDIEDGLVDMAVGPFWVTGQRLRMSSFSLPFTYDKTYLVIPNPGTTDNLNFQIQKVLQPFSLGLWGLVLAVIATAALLSVWFADNEKLNADRRREGMARPSNRRRRKKRVSMAIYGRLAFDQCLQKGLFFCSAGVEQDNTSSLPDKLLLFGFGFFILIAVSAYVANLAAFLTLSSASDAVTSIDQAVALGIKICAHPAVKTELLLAHPDANFFFHEDGDEFVGMLNDYDAGKCKLLAIGYEDTSNNGSFLDKLCERELVYTESVIAEIPMAFPLRQGISSGFSYWMYQGERSGVTLETSKSEFPVVANCDVHLNTDVTEGSETDQITIKNMFLPIIFFVVCAFIAVILQIKHMRNVKQGRKSLVGRRSTFNLTQSVAVEKHDGIDDFDTKQLQNNLAPLRRRPNPPVLDENFSFDNGGGEEEDKKGGLPQSMSCRSLMTGEFSEQQEKNNNDSFLEDFPGVSRSKLDV